MSCHAGLSPLHSSNSALPALSHFSLATANKHLSITGSPPGTTLSPNMCHCGQLHSTGSPSLRAFGALGRIGANEGRACSSLASGGFFTPRLCRAIAPETPDHSHAGPMPKLLRPYNILYIWGNGFTSAILGLRVVQSVSLMDRFLEAAHFFQEMVTWILRHLPNKPSKKVLLRAGLLNLCNSMIPCLSYSKSNSVSTTGGSSQDGGYLFSVSS